MARVAPDATAFADRDAASTLLITSGWANPHDTEARVAWARDLERRPALRQALGLHQRPGRGRRAAHGSDLWRQLPAAVAVKRIYDPENLFRHDANFRL